LKKQGIKIIEDGATNLDIKINYEFVDSLDYATCFNFHSRKIITTGEKEITTTIKSD